MSFKLFLDADGKPQFDGKGLPLFMQDGAAEPASIDVNAMIDDNRAKKRAAEAAKRERDELAARVKASHGPDPDVAGKLANLEKVLADERAGAANAMAEKERMIHGLLVENAFFSSSFLREKTVLPPEFAYAALGKNFSIEYPDGKPVVVARDAGGNPIFSASNPASYAGPEEAIRILVEQHPQRDALLKAAAPLGGSGALPGARPGEIRPKSLADCRTEAERVAYLKEIAAQ